MKDDFLDYGSGDTATRRVLYDVGCELERIADALEDSEE